jgi:alanine racemase
MYTWAEIDVGAIVANWRAMEALSGTRVAPVVKGNAYGHGMLEIARALGAAGVEIMCVARAEEALELRAAGLRGEILVLGWTPPEQIGPAVQRAITLTVFDRPAAEAVASSASSQGLVARVHLKVDTGMTRLGALPDEAIALGQWLSGQPDLAWAGVFQHFAGADEADLASARRQLQVFHDVLAAWPQRPASVHACNTAGALTLPEARFDLIRLGIGLYGLHPSAAVPLPAVFRPALTWKARVTQVKTVPAGTGMSYGHQYVASETETVAVVSVGYADGYRRLLGVNELLVRGQLAPVRGRVCMDQVTVGVSHIPDVRVGDEAIVLGGLLSADVLARRWGTINYDVTSSILARVQRLYR